MEIQLGTLTSMFPCFKISVQYFVYILSITGILKLCVNYGYVLLNVTVYKWNCIVFFGLVWLLGFYPSILNFTEV